MSSSRPMSSSSKVLSRPTSRALASRPNSQSAASRPSTRQKTGTVEDEYFAKAQKAVNENDMKYALVLLKKVGCSDRESVALMVNAAYSKWIEIREDKEEHEQEMSMVNDTFTKVLGSSAHFDLHPMDYIRLSHLYLYEGNLSGSLQIMQLASARGHLENSLILLQTWTLIKRLQSTADANQYMSYLSTSIATESTLTQDPSKPHCFPESELPVSYAFLHVASYLKRISMYGTSLVKKTAAFTRFQAILSEGYYLHTRDERQREFSFITRWFGDPFVWSNMATNLQSSPFVLLTEDCYWEAFVRAPLAELAIRRIVDSMKQFYRDAAVPALLAKAYEVNPWNAFVRTSLLAFEEKLEPDESKRRWAELFAYQNRLMVKIQALVRRWFVKKHWVETKNFLMAVQHEHFQKVGLAEVMYARYIKKMKKRLVDRWWTYVNNWQWEQYNAATKLQSHRRRMVQRLAYKWMQYRVTVANSIYLPAVQLHYDHTRINAFRKWYAYQQLLLKQRAATTITKVMQLNGSASIVTAAVDLFVKVLKIQKRILYFAVRDQWFDAMEQKKKRIARVTIRFFLRGCYTREQRKQEAREAAERAAELERRELLLRQAQFQVSSIPVYTWVWDIWRIELNKIYVHRAKVKVARMLKLLHARQKGRAAVRGLRTRWEAQRAFVLKAEYDRVAINFMPWKFNANAKRIQRFARCAAARKLLKRHQRVARHVEYFIEDMAMKTKRKMFLRIQKFLFLQHREQLRASKWVIFFFRKLVHRTLIRNTARKKMRYLDFSFALHFMSLRSAFNKMKNGANNAHMMGVLTAEFITIKRVWLTDMFGHWESTHRQQGLVKALVTSVIIDKLDRLFWPDCSTSVAISSQFQVLRQQIKISAADSKNNEEDDGNVFSPALKPYEERIADSPILLDISKIAVLKAFKSWMTCFRLRNRYKRTRSTFMSKEIANSVIDLVLQRRKTSVEVQCFFRKIRAQQTFHRKLAHHRLFQEKEKRVYNQRLMRIWRAVCGVTNIRMRKVLTLQCFFRVQLARIRFRRVAKHYVSIMRAEEIVSQSRTQRSLTKKYMRIFEMAYCSSVLRSVRSSYAPKMKKAAPLFSSSATNIRIGTNGSSNRAAGKKKSKTKKRLVGTGNDDDSSGEDDSGIEEYGYNAYDEEDSRSAFSASQRGEGHQLLPLPALGSNNSYHQRASGEKNRMSAAVLPPLPAAATGHLRSSSSSSSSVADASFRSNKSRAKQGNASSGNTRGNASFKSERFFQYLFHLKQSGTFIYEDKPVSGLTTEEVVYCLRNSSALFCQNVHKSKLLSASKYFSGNKIVLNGGNLSENGVTKALSSCLNGSSFVPVNLEVAGLDKGATSKLQSIKEQPQQLRNYDFLAVHFCAVTMTHGARILFVNMLAPPPPPPPPQTITSAALATGGGGSDSAEVKFDNTNTVTTAAPHTAANVGLNRVTEIFLDTHSFGVLGSAVLLCSLEFNQHLQVLIIKGAPVGDCLGSLDACLSALGRNTSLSELRFIGLVLNNSCLRALQRGLKQGFASLRLLEFTIDDSGECSNRRNQAEALAGEIMNAAKDRAYTGRSGVSVTINSKN